MNMRKITSLLLALAMTLALASCGGNTADAPSNGGSASDTPSGDGGQPAFEKMTWAANTAGAAGSNFAAGLEKFAELMSEGPTAP